MEIKLGENKIVLENKLNLGLEGMICFSKTIRGRGFDGWAWRTRTKDRNGRRRRANKRHASKEGSAGSVVR